jgi:long-chain acyl-CoA synthetase
VSATSDPAVVAADPLPWIERGVTQLRSLRLQEGDRIVVLRGGDLATFGLLTAACLEGVVAVPLPPDLSDAELATILDDAEPTAVLTEPGVTRAVRALAASGHPAVAVSTDDLAALPGTTPSADWPRTRPMAYTSGTTGRRKGVHAGVHEPAWGQALIADEHAAFDHRHGERHLVVSPLYHSGPFRFALVTALTGGSIAVLPRFDAAGWRDALRSVRPSSLFCVPTHLHRLLALPDLAPDDLSSLTLLAHAGAPCPIPLKERVLDVAPAGTVWEFYGSTEGQFTVASPEVWRSAPGTVGVARPDRRIEVRGDDGRPVPTGQVGTVWAHVPAHAHFTYWRDPERTAAAWDGDAFTVGDLGRLDEAGRLTLEGRPGDLVISGGVNVYPAEVERALLGLPGVAEAVAFGVPDDEWGERLVAAVVPWPGRTLDGARLREALRAEVSRAKVPKAVLVVTELPRTPTGKVRRPGLAEALGASTADGPAGGP